MFADVFKRMQSLMLLATFAAGAVAVGGCQPDRKADNVSEEGLVDFDGEYTEPSDTPIDPTEDATAAPQPPE